MNDIDLTKIEAIVIGTSYGGFEALSALLPRLPAEFDLPIIIVQHLSPDAENYSLPHLDEKSQIRVKEAEDKEPICPGTAYIAPPDYHLLIEKDRSFSLSIDETKNHARPSIEVMFASACEVYGPSLLAVALTSASTDGVEALRQISAAGGKIIAQKPETAVSPVFPGAAISNISVHAILSVDEIGDFLVGFAKEETTR